MGASSEIAVSRTRPASSASLAPTLPIMPRYAAQIGSTLTGLRRSHAADLGNVGQEFRDFIRWTFGTEDVGAIVTDSRQLSDWGKILESSQALAYLRRSAQPSFDRAWFRSGGQAESVAESLFVASDHLEEAVPLVSELTGDKDVKDSARQCARFLQQILTHFPEIARGYATDQDD